MKSVFFLVLCFALLYKCNSQYSSFVRPCCQCGSYQQVTPGNGDEGTCEELENKVNAHQNFITGLLRSTKALDEYCGMGMKNKAIPNSAITSSSHWSSSYAAYQGRIDHLSMWVANPSSLGQWIQIDLGTSRSISGVVTQGRVDYDQWISSFKIHCGDQPNNLAAITEKGSVKIFDGNSDRNTKVTNKFSTPIVCRYIRLYPEAWNGQISMRMELLRGDCYAFY